MATTDAPKRVLVLGADHSEAAHAALQWTMSNLYREGDCLHMVHCFRPLQPAVGPHYSYVPTEEEQANWRKQQAHVLEEYVAEAKKATPHLVAKAVLVVGDARDEIVAYAEAEQAVAIVIGSRGHGAFKRAVLGSVSSHLVHHSSVPVTVVHAKQ